MEIFNINGELEEDAADVLYELGNVGVATAIMPIGNIRELEIKIGTPNVIAIDKDLFECIDYDPDQVVVGVATRLNDTLDGVILFLLGKEFVSNTVYKMTEEKFDDDELLKNEDSVSAIQEMTNYMTAGYAKVIGAYLDIPVYITTASVGVNKAKNVIRDVMANVGSKFDRIACVNTRFTIVDEDGETTDEAGQVLIFPDENCIKKFMEVMSE